MPDYRSADASGLSYLVRDGSDLLEPALYLAPPGRGDGTGASMAPFPRRAKDRRDQMVLSYSTHLAVRLNSAF
ncbi:protein of unknown function [Candidatus Filomicrobium marinum]|uniref:Uncharacterized protein n=1 Tax=Candidatus Filomicrobium marinum TaxID=1608628 RepID=A0A0D6JEF6_9HYPH|nr:protein of unknown function [Candidatus Filomicrobium marinum]CPR18674.1 protein of unknown function [Candidatus Filomicrobium marinum]